MPADAASAAGSVVVSLRTLDGETALCVKLRRAQPVADLEAAAARAVGTRCLSLVAGGVALEDPQREIGRVLADGADVTVVKLEALPLWSVSHASLQLKATTHFSLARGRCFDGAERLVYSRLREGEASLQLWVERGRLHARLAATAARGALLLEAHGSPCLQPGVLAVLRFGDESGIWLRDLGDGSVEVGRRRGARLEDADAVFHESFAVDTPQRRAASLPPGTPVYRIEEPQGSRQGPERHASMPVLHVQLRPGAEGRPAWRARRYDGACGFLDAPEPGRVVALPLSPSRMEVARLELGGAAFWLEALW